MTMLEFVTAFSFYLSLILFVVFFVHVSLFVFNRKYYDNIGRAKSEHCDSYLHEVIWKLSVPICIFPFLSIVISLICWFCINVPFAPFYAEKAYQKGQKYMHSNKVISNPYMLGDIRYEAFELSLKEEHLDAIALREKLWK